MSEPQPDFTGLQGYTPDPGFVAQGTVSSGQIAPWLMENVPEIFQPRGDAQTPLLEPNRPVLDPGDTDLGPVNRRWEGTDYVTSAVEQANLAAGTHAQRAGQSGAEWWQVPLDLALNATGMVGGAGVAARSVTGGALRNLMRYRPWTRANMDEVARILQEVAPVGMRPAEATAEGISDVARTGIGMRALGAAKQRIVDAISGELNQITAAAQQQAAQGMTGQYAARAAAGVRDLAGEFRTLVDELADATSAAYSRAQGQLRGGMNVLPALRSREAIYQDLQALLSPDQFRRFMDYAQTPYAQGTAVEYLFKAAKSGSDVLLDRKALQERTKTMLKRLGVTDLSPELVTRIFRGGRPVTTDMPAKMPVGIAKGGVKLSPTLPGQVLAGPVGPVGEVAATTGGALAGLGVSEAAQVAAPIGWGYLQALGRMLNPYMTGERK